MKQLIINMLAIPRGCRRPTRAGCGFEKGHRAPRRMKDIAQITNDRVSWSLLVSYTDSSRVLTVALAVFRSQAPQTGPDWAGLMAATLWA